MTKVKLMTRQRTPARGRSEAKETVIMREQDVVAVLPDGDPISYLLHLPLDRLQNLQRNLTGVLHTRPRLKMVMEALIEYQRERVSIEEQSR